MKICPRCEAGYPDELTTCPLHGGLLSEIRDLKPGMLVRGTYRILRKISQGGMGHVYLAQHILLDEPQVLKFLSNELQRDQAWYDRFLREVRTLRQIRHKNVVNAGNLEPAEDGSLFFSMEYVEGPDLLEFYRHAPKPFDVPLALTIIRGAAEGLGAAHAAGVVHRDIKPENILIAREDNMPAPKIADFGIVATREATRLTQSGTTMLTPQFAAPEQWLGTPTAELDGRTDLYALGGVLFELLTGRSAFNASNYQAWALQHLNAQPPAPSSLRPELANWRGLDELVLRLMAKDPNHRPQDVREVLRLLKQIEYIPPEHEVAREAEPTAPKRTATPVKVDRDSFKPAAEPAKESSALVKPQPAEKQSGTGPNRHSRGNEHPSEHGDEQRREHMPKSFQEAVPAAAQAAEIPHQSSPGPSVHPRRQIPADPMPIWEPIQPRSPVKRRTFIRFAESEGSEGGQRDYGLPILIALAVVLAVVFAVSSMMVSPIVSTTLTLQRGAILSVAFSPNGLTLASASRDNTVQFWNVSDGRPLGLLAASSTSLAYSPVGNVIATGMTDYTINVWDATRDVVLVTLPGQHGPVAALAFSPNGRTLASGSWDTTVRLWDVSSGGLVRTIEGSMGRVLSVAYSPDGRVLASAGTDRLIRLWNPLTGAPLRRLQGHAGSINSIAFSPNGSELASAGDDGTIRLWDVSSGETMRTVQAESGAILSVAFSADGRMMASGGSDGLVRLWSARTGRLLRTLKGHSGPVLSVAFSPFGSTLASAGADKTIRLWEVAQVDRRN